MNGGKPRETLGLIGLGLVGRALAVRLAAAGFVLLGFDRDAAAREAWIGQGYQLADSPAAIGATCTRCVLAVFDSDGVLDVVEGAQGLLAGMPERPSAIHAIVDCSTGDPDRLQALAARLGTRSVDFIEAPLSGSSQQIAAGMATVLLGASSAAIEGHADLIDAIATQRIHVGGAGMGARAKLATNLVLGLNRAALAEGIVLAERLGIAPETFLQLVLQTPARSDAALVKGPQMVEGRFDAPQSRVRQHLKDLDLMLAQAAAAGQRLPLAATHAELLRRAVAAGDGELDNAAVLRQLQRERTS
jgi:3-hydroxyisobutyrate dehydrogenase-like beta-hydroxyacid dehydrogenase